MAKRWLHRPEGSNWGEFGDDDELGRLNLLTPEKVRQGIAEVIEGETFCLSLPLDYPGGAGLFPMRSAPTLGPTVLDGRRAFNLEAHPPGSDILCDDVVQLYLQYSTQWDSLCHIGSRFDADGDGKPETVFYNGYRGGTDIVGGGEGRHLGALKLGIEKMAAKSIQGRAVLIDLEAHFGGAPHEVSYADLAEVMKKDRVVVEPGDMVCLHTGLADLILSMNKNPDPEKIFASCATLDGNDPKLRDWISESGLCALIADNVAVESVKGLGMEPKLGATQMPIHEHCLFKLGVPLGELWHLGPLAAWLRVHKRSRFLLTAPPLYLPHAVGSPVTPVATV
jgi:kynurenine formamidase